MDCIHLFPVYLEIFTVFSYDKTSQHSKWMDNLNIDWSSGWIFSGLFGCEGKIHKPKPWTYQCQKWNFTPTPNPYAQPNVDSRPYSNSISTTCLDFNQGPSSCKLIVQTTTPPVLDTILIQQQAIILPR